MNCSDTSTLTPLFLSGELDEAQANALADHLTICEACAREIGRQKIVDESLRESIREEPVDATRIEQQVRASIRAESRKRLFAALAIAAAILLAFIGYRAVLASRPKAFYSAAADDHRREIVEGQQRPWQTDQAAIVRLAEAQGVPAVAATALAPAGFHLAQGRLCFLNGRIFVHLLYKDANGNMSLFLRAQQTPHFSDRDAEAFGMEHVSGIQKNKLTALVVSDQSDATAMRVSSTLAAAL
jgi:anti-sigma factor RsiW